MYHFERKVHSYYRRDTQRTGRCREKDKENSSQKGEKKSKIGIGGIGMEAVEVLDDSETEEREIQDCIAVQLL